jgi:hypothetical protein
MLNDVDINYLNIKVVMIEYIFCFINIYHNIVFDVLYLNVFLVNLMILYPLNFIINIVGMSMMFNIKFCFQFNYYYNKSLNFSK